MLFLLFTNASKFLGSFTNVSCYLGGGGTTIIKMFSQETKIFSYLFFHYAYNFFLQTQDFSIQKV